MTTPSPETVARVRVIDGALRKAMSMVDTASARPTYVLFLTDGLPTEGEVEIPAILENVQTAAPDGIRLFSFGVGYDVDTILLDTISRYHQESIEQWKRSLRD